MNVAGNRRLIVLGLFVRKGRIYVSRKRLAISLGLSALTFGGLHRLASRPPRGARGWRDPDVASGAPVRAATAGIRAERSAGGHPGVSRRRLARLRELGFEFVSLAEAVRRLSGSGPRFVALTFDDGYQDFADHALPILERHEAPATMFLCPGFIDGTARLWWLELEEAIRRLDSVGVERFGPPLPARDAREKSEAYQSLYWKMRAEPESALLDICGRLVERAGVADGALRAGLFLDWRALERLAAHPLISMGAHSLTHLRLAQWPETVARNEIAGSKAALEERIGTPRQCVLLPNRRRRQCGAARIRARARERLFSWRNDPSRDAVFRARLPFACSAASFSQRPLAKPGQPRRAHVRRPVLALEQGRRLNVA